MALRHGRSIGVLIVSNLLGGVGVASGFAVGGLLAQSLGGTSMAGFAQAASTLGAAIAANGVFVPGDLAKAAVTAVVAAQVHRARPGLIPPLRRQRSPRA